MCIDQETGMIEELKRAYPQKFTSKEKIFSHIKRGNKLFIGTAAGEPRYLVRSLVSYLDQNPKAFFDADIFYVWTLPGARDSLYEKYRDNFRINSLFIGEPNRDAINKGAADYTPIFLSRIPELFDRKYFPIDIAIIQTSLPDEHGYFNLGVNVDFVKAAIENAALTIVQANAFMPRVHGDGFIHIDDIDFVIPYDEPLPEYDLSEKSEIALKIGNYVASIVQDGDTLQIGYGSIPFAVLPCLGNKKHLGIHSEILNDGIVELMKKGVIDNSKKTLNKGKTIGSYCFGKRETYKYINNNPAIELRRIDYVNNFMTIAQHDNMTAINTALQIDLTGQATAESLGKVFYSGIGGFANYMRAAVMANKGKTILVMRSVTNNGEFSKIVPSLPEGSGVSLHRGDVQYVVTEYGIAYLQGKNLRERAMELISIAHPQFRPWLIHEAKQRNLIFQDQKIIPGPGGKYIEEYESHKTTKSGLDILLRPVKISDEPRLRDFFNSLSDRSLYTRFFNVRSHVPREDLQQIITVDNARGVSILAVIQQDENQIVVGLGQYFINETDYSAEVSFATSDSYKNNGISTILLSYLTLLARKNGIPRFTATVLAENQAMIRVLRNMGFTRTNMEYGAYEFELIL